jgi:hypothetical protein
MMSLVDVLREDLKKAMRARDEHRKAALRMALTNIQLAEVDAKSPLSDADIVQLIRREVRRREDALEMMKQAGREDLVADETYEIEILQAYLPELLSEEQVGEVVREVIAEIGASSPADMGQVMKTIMPRVKGKADGRMVNQIVRRLLADKQTST